MKQTNQQIVKIRKLSASGLSIRKIGAQFGLSVGAVQKIVTGKTYKDAGGPVRVVGSPTKGNAGGSNPNSKLSVQQVIDIRSKANEGYPRSMLARENDVSRSTIDKIVIDDSWDLSYAAGKLVAEFPDNDLLQIRLKERRPSRDSEDEERLLARVERAYDSYGYPYRRWNSSQFHGVLESVKECAPRVEDDLTIEGKSVAGLRLINAFHPSIDHINRKGQKSPVDAFHDPILRRRALLGQIRHGSRLTPGGVRSAMTEVAGSSQISSFRPTIAYTLLEHFKVKSFLDPCAGWGGRMVAALASGVDYVGIDPSVGAIVGNRGFLAELERHYPHSSPVTLINECAEDVLGSDRDIGLFDFVFTSPPYFDLEHYSTEPTQSYLRYPQLDAWEREFLQVVLEGSAKRLTPGGRIGINVYGKLEGSVLRAAGRTGLVLVETLQIQFPARRWQKATGAQYRNEPIFVFQRSN